MSRLIDELLKTTQSAGQPMGFRAARPAAAAGRITLIADLKIGAAVSPVELTEGASAVLLRPGNSRPTMKAFQAMVDNLPDIPWGIYLEDIGDGKTASTLGAGCDFIVFPASVPVSATPQEEKLGRVLQVESLMDDGLLRAINELPVDAAFIGDTPGEGDSLVWHRLMILQHLTHLISKPLIVPVHADIGEEELNALCEAGIDGILVEVDTGKAGGLKELRQAIDKLPPRSPHIRDKMRPLLPRTGVESPTAVPPDEEEEEDE
jgi:hypothetical protein